MRNFTKSNGEKQGEYFEATGVLAPPQTDNVAIRQGEINFPRPVGGARMDF